MANDARYGFLAWNMGDGTLHCCSARWSVLVAGGLRRRDTSSRRGQRIHLLIHAGHVARVETPAERYLALGNLWRRLS
jgi:hypothetical protein